VRPNFTTKNFGGKLERNFLRSYVDNLPVNHQCQSNEGNFKHRHQIMKYQPTVSPVCDSPREENLFAVHQLPRWPARWVLCPFWQPATHVNYSIVWFYCLFLFEWRIKFSLSLPTSVTATVLWKTSQNRHQLDWLIELRFYVRHKIGHFGDVLPSLYRSLVLKVINLNLATERDDITAIYGHDTMPMLSGMMSYFVKLTGEDIRHCHVI